MAEYTPMYKHTGKLRTGAGPDNDTLKKNFDEMETKSKNAKRQLPVARGGTKPNKKMPTNYEADLDQFKVKLYQKLRTAYQELDNNEMVPAEFAPDGTEIALHELIVRETKTYYEQVKKYLDDYQVPGKVATGLKKKAKSFQRKTEKRRLKYGTDTPTRDWEGAPEAFGAFKQIYVDFYQDLINSFKASEAEQIALRKSAHDGKSKKLSKFFNDTYPEFKKKRPS